MNIFDELQYNLQHLFTLPMVEDNSWGWPDQKTRTLDDVIARNDT